MLLFNPFGRVAVQVPSAPTGTFSTSVLLPDLMVTVAPGVPVPEIVLSVELTPAPGILFAVAGIVGVTTGAAGVASLATLGFDSLPAASVALAVTGPAGISTFGVIVALPFSPAVASPILLLSLS